MSYATNIGLRADFLRDGVERAVDCGVPLGRIILDPRYGLSKNTCHSLELMRRLGEIAAIALCATEYGGRGFSAINYAGMRMTAVHYGFFPIEVRNSGCLLHSSQEPV